MLMNITSSAEVLIFKLLLLVELDFPPVHISFWHIVLNLLSNGQLNFTESDIEANNKFLRQYCINNSRKTNQYENLSDCINRLWDKSDPLVV